MRIFKYGKLFEAIYPKRTWSKKTKENVIYLTFDDGPVPEATPFVLQELAKVKAKATFFIVGDNVLKHPEIYKRVVAEGHRVGNHTMNHVKGTECRKQDYLENIASCEALIEKDNKPMLFRPPYGKMTHKQQEGIDAELIMWSVLTYDFDDRLSAEDCLAKAISLTKKGSIVVMHDSVKTIKKLQYVLPKYLAHFTNKGFEFRCL